MASTETIVDELRADILSAVFLPGERLVELDLTERYGCGRAVVRAALVHLESEGLVDRQVNRGAVVHRISVDEAIEITEARAALEGFIAGRAAAKADESDVGRLQALVEEMRMAVAQDDAASYSDVNRRLHAVIREIAGHGIAGQLVQNLRNRGVQGQFHLSRLPGRQAASLTQHEAIVNAIAAGDEEAAVQAMTTHLTSVVDVLRRWEDGR